MNTFRKPLRKSHAPEDYSIPVREIFRYRGHKAAIWRNMFEDYWLIDNEEFPSFRISEGVTQARATHTIKLIKHRIDQMSLGTEQWMRCGCYTLFRWRRDQDGTLQHVKP